MRRWQTFRFAARAALAMALFLPFAGGVKAQSLLHQPDDGAAITDVPSNILSRLDDPFFRIVIEQSPSTQSLNDLIELIQSDPHTTPLICGQRTNFEDLKDRLCWFPPHGDRLRRHECCNWNCA